MATLNWLFVAVWTCFSVGTFDRIPEEERDLVHVFGDEYLAYRARTPALGPLCCCTSPCFDQPLGPLDAPLLQSMP